MTRTTSVLLLIVAVLSLATACGAGSTSAPPVAHAGSGSGTSASPSAPNAGDRQSGWLRYASCLRQHGADEPDPTFDSSGNPQWAVNVKSLPQTALQACASVLQTLNLQPAQAADPARIAAATRFAQCIRQHGIANFPDPDSSGNFPTNGDPTQLPGWAAAFQACQSLQPAGKS